MAEENEDIGLRGQLELAFEEPALEPIEAPTAAPAEPAPAASSPDEPPERPAGNIPAAQVRPAEVAAPVEPAIALKAPASWRPEQREKWAKLDSETQAEIIRREREITKTLSSTAEARKRAEEFDKVSAPYQHLIAAEGGNTVAAYGDYLKTVSLLKTGSPHEKASALAQAAIKFGVDVNALDAALTGAMSGRPQTPPPEFKDPRLDGLLQQLEEQKAERQADLDAQAEQTVAQFSSTDREFLEDVRQEMADLLDYAAQKGRHMSLEDAYNRACASNSEIVKVLDQRRVAASAAAAAATVATKRRASSSVTDTGGRASRDPGAPLSLREQLAQSFET